ncbi:MAG: hypothetical protein CMLOHMNK_00718 [Steroidobacteraceae bacterium]|nr:hypothetical protein [Steroidobacteraceae bacterium]
MSSRAASWLLAGLALSGIAAAETIVVDGQVAVRATNVEHPSRGATMASVEQRFGAPASKHAAVGQPPITRWDYAQFSVFFENDRVIHAVVTGG